MEPEGGEERERERGKKVFSLIFKIHGDQAVGFRRSEKEKLIHALQAMRGYQNLGVFVKLHKVGNFSYWGYFYLKGHLMACGFLRGRKF